jgi:hypothetical protein
MEESLIFDWHNSKIGRNAQSVGMIHEGAHYLLTASPTIREGEFQAMCNSVRVTKDLFASISEAKIACEKWFRREVLGEVWDAEAELGKWFYDNCNAIRDGVLDCEAFAKAILANFKVEPL